MEENRIAVTIITQKDVKRLRKLYSKGLLVRSYDKNPDVFLSFFGCHARSTCVRPRGIYFVNTLGTPNITMSASEVTRQMILPDENHWA